MSAVAAVALHPGPREALRDATHGAHLRMHALPQFAAIAAQRLTRLGYAQLIRALFQFHSAIAAAAERSGFRSISSSGRRLELLILDLSHLGIAMPLRLPHWEPVDAEAMLGALYVAEGSMIGGKLIARQLDYLFGDGDGDGDGGRRFFRGSGAQDSLAWRRLVGLLDERLASGAALNSAIAGALGTFDLFEMCVAMPSATAYSPGLTRNCSMRPLAGS